MDTATPREAYPSDISDDEWAFVAPYLTLMREDAPQRRYPVREVLNGVRWVVRTGAQWRMLPHDLPPWEIVDQHAERWLKAGTVSRRPPLRIAARCRARPKVGIGQAMTGASAARGARSTSRSTPWGICSPCPSRPPDAQDRAQVDVLAAASPQVTGGAVAVAFVEQGHTGQHPAEDAASQAITLKVVKLPAAKRGFILLPRRWVVERSFPWTGRFRRLAKDYERLAETVAVLHVIALPV